MTLENSDKRPVFNQDRFSKILQDYTLFHPSVDQMVLITELSAELAERLKIDSHACRQLYIKAIVQYQHEEQRLHYTNEKNLPQFKLRRSERINAIIVDLLMGYVDTPTDYHRAYLNQMIEEVFTIYLKKYAARTYDMD